ncbi:hypothetical protein ebA435 [Aromatoleum aromaticum EbN1]|uniref:Lipoprotein n=2 Tax=Aromatoleum aromaticum TaxID=551760 RepID=Q5P8L0_AROAE|nr:hypothetical protein ebA435 [Aromatoleum aromaticum EbN1]
MKCFPSFQASVMAALALLHLTMGHAAEPSGKAHVLAGALFASVPSGSLSGADRAAVAALAPLALRDGVVVSTVRGCETAMHPEVALEDLNGDRVPEVFILAGNTCTSGMTGKSVWLFARRRDGRWAQLLDAGAAGYRILPTATFGWRDIALGGRGFCEGLWRLGPQGEYDYARSIQADGTPCPER